MTRKSTKTQVRRQLAAAYAACRDKKAEDISILELGEEHGGFTDYFLICSGSNPRQIQAISDEVQDKLEQAGVTARHTEGYQQAEWILLDYVDFVVHIFSRRARSFYDLERLWKSAARLDAEALLAAPRKKRPAGARAPKAPGSRRPAARRRTARRPAP
jgi:ribosome-associated protein